jgi:hypothetical protein
LRNESKDVLTATLRKTNGDTVDKLAICTTLSNLVAHAVFGEVLPLPFIASIERTGAATFWRELDITRNTIIEDAKKYSDISARATAVSILLDDNKRYALPVRDDVEFNRKLYDHINRDSAIYQSSPDILDLFSSILGGAYKITKEGAYFIPNKTNVRLSMAESASSVRSLLNLGIYLRHLAMPGQILMIDEPELNLHPKNQRLIARLLARLVNVGIKVFITTHSDYIIREFNTLMAFARGANNSDSNAKAVMTKHKYVGNEMVHPELVNAYLATKALINVGASKRIRRNTFVPIKIDDQGMDIPVFDETINLMNEIQDELMFGGEANVVE